MSIPEDSLLARRDGNRMELVAQLESVAEIAGHKIPDVRLQDFRSLLLAGEYEVALENLIENLFEYDVPASQTQRSDLNGLAKRLGLDARYTDIVARLADS
jgi:hypothetical protein